MRVMHRIGYGAHDDIEDRLISIGVCFQEVQGRAVSGSLLTFEISESDAQWPAVVELLRTRPAYNFVWTEYTRQEVLAAEWLIMAGARIVGSPQPEKANGWRAVSLEGGCTECGVGASQKAPFRVAREPRMGKHAFATLGNGWGLFCIPDVCAAFQAGGIRGFELWPVLVHRTSAPIETLWQLYVPDVAKPALVEEMAERERFASEACPVCGHVRYTFYNRGMLPLRRISLARDVDLQLTHEWFGTMHAARRGLLVSHRVARLVIERGWTGLVLWPVQLI